MGPDDIRTLVTELDRMPTSRVDLDRAMRDGRRIRRTRRVRRSLQAGAITVAVGMAATLGHLTGKPSVVNGRDVPPPPARFDPLIRYADFGWLPSNLTRRIWQTATDHLTLTAGIPDPLRHTSDMQLNVHLYPPGRRIPDLSRDRQPTAGGCTPYDFTEPMGRAPAVSGHSAWWVYTRNVLGRHCHLTVVQLRWQYAPGAWAVIVAGDLTGVEGDRRDVIRRIAQTLRIGTDEPVRLPFQAGYVPPGLTVTGTTETQDTEIPGHWSTNVVLNPRTKPTANGLPGLVITASPPGVLHDIAGPSEIVDGHSVYSTHDQLDVFDVQGLDVYIQTQNAAKARILHELHLLGPDRAAWTTRPIP